MGTQKRELSKANTIPNLSRSSCRPKSPAFDPLTRSGPAIAPFESFYLLLDSFLFPFPLKTPEDEDDGAETDTVLPDQPRDRRSPFVLVVDVDRLHFSLPRSVHICTGSYQQQQECSKHCCGQRIGSQGVCQCVRQRFGDAHWLPSEGKQKRAMREARSNTPNRERDSQDRISHLSPRKRGQTRRSHIFIRCCSSHPSLLFAFLD